MTILDEHRVERMRAVVMDAVDADVRRRGRRTRVVIRGGAALCALVVVAGVGAHFTTGGGTTTFQHGRASAGDSAAAVGGAVGPVPAARLASIPGNTGRSIVTTGSAHVITATPLKTADAFIAWVDSRSGRVAGQSDHGIGSKARVTLTVRVPDAESAIARLRALGSVRQVDTNADDVTTRATDLDARIKETRISIRRLEAILSRTSSVRDVLIAERALTTRQQQLESMVEQRKTLSDQIALATLDVTFTAKTGATTHSPGWFHRVFSSGLHKFGSGAGAALGVVGFLFPWLVLAGIIALLWAAVVRLTRRRT